MIGASAGIGASTAVEFAIEGAKLSITGRNAENLNKTGKKCEEAGLSKDDVGILTSVFQFPIVACFFLIFGGN